MFGRRLVGITLLAVLLAVLLALAAYAVTTYALAQDFGADIAAYLGAAERLRAGDPLYVDAGANASEQYRYAPWFAYVWIPLTWLDRDLVVAGWVGLMLAAAAASTLPLLRHGWTGAALFALMAPLQLQAAIFGNVQPLLVLMLLWGVERRSGPLWIAVGASLKAVPLALALVYAGRGEWRRAAAAAAITTVLVLPAFLFDLSGYSTNPGPNQMSLASVWFPAFVIVAAVTAIATFLLARTPYRWLAASLAMMAALPRLLTYEIGFLLIGLARRKDRAGSERSRATDGHLP